MRKRIISIAMVLALMAVLAIPVGAFAGSTATTSVTGDLGATINVTAPTAITFSTFAVGTNSANSTDGNCSVTGASAWTVTAQDLKSTNTGYMTNSGGTHLAKEMQISTNGTDYVNADTGVTYNNPTTFGIYVQQDVAAGDLSGSYSITITFTGAITN